MPITVTRPTLILRAGPSVRRQAGIIHFNSGYGVTTYGSTASSVITSGIVLRGNGSSMPFAVTAGTTSNGIDLLVSGNIVQYSAGGVVAGITKSLGGMMVLSGSNVYTGGTTISGGTLQIGNGSNTGTLGNGSIIDNATLSFNRNDTGMSLSAQVISGNGAVIQNGSGMTTLSATNTYSGNTLVSNGTLALGNGLALQNSTLDTSGSGPLNFGSLDCGHLRRPDQRRQPEHRQYGRRGRGPFGGQQQPDHHLLRCAERQRKPDQDRFRHADPCRHQRLHRHHHREQRRVGYSNPRRPAQRCGHRQQRRGLRRADWRQRLVEAQISTACSPAGPSTPVPPWPSTPATAATPMSPPFP